MNRPLAACLIALALTVGGVGSACVPTKRGKSVEVDKYTRSNTGKAPELPASNPSKSQLVAALEFDLSARPDDQNFWTPNPKEASCVSDKIVAELGPERLSQLGYKPGTPGAGLPNLALTADEHAKVLAAFTTCVNMREAAASILFGKGRISNSSALCLARVLDEAGAIVPLFDSWLSAKPIDPFANGAILADRLSAGASVCLTPKDLDWPTIHLPSDNQDLIDADSPGGSSNSNRPDDHRPQQESTP